MKELNLSQVQRAEFSRAKSIESVGEKPSQGAFSGSEKDYAENDFRAVCRNMLGKTYSKIVITNEERKDRQGKPLYRLTIDFNTILLDIERSDQKDSYRYNYKNETLYRGDRPQQQEKNHEFAVLLNKIGKLILTKQLDCLGEEKMSLNSVYIRSHLIKIVKCGLQVSKTLLKSQMQIIGHGERAFQIVI